MTAAALVFLSLAGGLAATLIQARQTAAEAQRAEAAVHFLEALFVAADPRQEPGYLPDARELLRRGSERLAGELADQPLLRARLLDTLGGIHTALGLYDEARPQLEEALALRQKLLGAEHPDVAETLVRLGSLAHLSGKGDAVALFERALVIREARARREPAELADLLKNWVRPLERRDISTRRRKCCSARWSFTSSSMERTTCGWRSSSTTSRGSPTTAGRSTPPRP